MCIFSLVKHVFVGIKRFFVLFELGFVVVKRDFVLVKHVFVLVKCVLYKYSLSGLNVSLLSGSLNKWLFFDVLVFERVVCVPELAGNNF